MELNQEVVIMQLSVQLGAVPISHNSKHSPARPCRGRVLKVGRKWLHIENCDRTPIKVAPYVVGQDWHPDGWYGVPVDEAKRLYRESLTANRAWRTDEFIADCVEKL